MSSTSRSSLAELRSSSSSSPKLSSKLSSKLSFKLRRALSALMSPITLVVSLLILCASVTSGYTRPATGELTVHFINIGQGDAALIISPTGKTVLLDTGPSKSWSSLSGYIDALGVKRIDLLINSHPHADHIGNAARAISRYEIPTVLDPGFQHPIRAYRDMLDTIKVREAKLALARKGREIGIGGGAKIEVLAPEDPFISGSRSDPNSNSIVFRLTYKGSAALFTGDAEAETEHRLLRDPKRLSAGLLKVAHHGSAHASSRAFLDAVKPQHAVVSCGVNNRYGHPAPETMSGLTRSNIKTWVTASSGSVVATTRGGDAWSVAPSQVKVSVSPRRARVTPQHVAVTKGGSAQGDSSQGDSSQGDSSQGDSSQGDSASGKVNVNTASAAELKRLPRIGVKLAARIIEARRAGRFTSADDLRRRVRGIGEKTASNLAPLITF